MQLLALVALAAYAAAKTIPIKVSDAGSRLAFTPNIIAADPGDVLEFRFLARIHDVAMGVFATPCRPSPRGFYSGVVETDDARDMDQVFSVTVNDTAPFFFYCSIGPHCARGMHGVVNQGADTLEAYGAAAAAWDDMGVAPVGGVFGGARSSRYRDRSHKVVSTVGLTVVTSAGVTATPSATSTATLTAPPTVTSTAPTNTSTTPTVPTETIPPDDSAGQKIVGRMTEVGLVVAVVVAAVASLLA